MEESLNNLDQEDAGLLATNVSSSSKTQEIEETVNVPPDKKLIKAHRTEAFYGPIPPPDLLEKYNNIVPNAADRILAMAEQQQLHRQLMEKTVVQGDVKRADKGLLLGFIITLLFGAGGIYLLATNHDLNGLAVFFAPLAGLVGTFIYSQKIRKEERIQKSQTLAERNTKSTNDSFAGKE